VQPIRIRIRGEFAERRGERRAERVRSTAKLYGFVIGLKEAADFGVELVCRLDVAEMADPPSIASCDRGIFAWSS
jgi:hypothetical protein